MTRVRRSSRVVGRFKPDAPVGTINETQQALPEHNAGPQKGTGRQFAPSHLDNATFCGEVLSLNPSQQRVRYASRRPRASVQHTPRRHA